MEFPADVLVEILVRLPWTSRRRLRLVCRSWRNLIHQRTTEMHECRDAVPLVVTTESAYLIYDLDSSNTPIPRELWPGGINPYSDMEVVGVTNGVLCLCDNAKPGGAITLVNPATGDVLSFPPIPCAGRRPNTRRSGRSWHQAYSFGYNHATGQYKVVHVTCFFKTKETVQVFTVGEASWREVPAPAAKCKLQSGIVSAGGATYWVTEAQGWEMIMSFDHQSEQVTCATPLPNWGRGRAIGHLSETQRRLSITIATSDHRHYYPSSRGYGYIEVWVLECAHGRKDQTWNNLYSLRDLPLPKTSTEVARPTFIHGHGDHVLMVGEQGQRLKRFRRQSTSSYVDGPKSNAVHVNYFSYKGTTSDMRGDICQTFEYIKNTDRCIECVQALVTTMNGFRING